MEHDLFSAGWLMEYSMGPNGCAMARESYTWRVHGFGSNVNNLLNAWVWALSVERWNDIALVVDPPLIDQVDCAESSNGRVSTGWNCLFSPMPHLCQFNSTEEWVEHMRSRDASEDDVIESKSVTQELVRGSSDIIAKSLEGMAVDHFKALSIFGVLSDDKRGLFGRQVMAEYLWSHLTPWVKDDMRKVTDADAVAALHNVPFVGIHIRRGDKITQHEAKFYDVEQYLAAGVEFILHSKGGHAWHRTIRGIWVASDDPNVIDEVRQLYPLYFPYVEPELVVWVSDGVQGALETKGVTTYSSRQRYPSYVYMFTDLKQLAKAEVFVGTFSSNVGRLVALLREAAGKSRKSSISIDRDWAPGRV